MANQCTAIAKAAKQTLLFLVKRPISPHAFNPGTFPTNIPKIPFYYAWHRTNIVPKHTLHSPTCYAAIPMQ